MAKFKFKVVGDDSPQWDSLCETWDSSKVIWDECIPILKKIKLGGSRGGVRKDKDCWNEWDNLNFKNKQKVFRCICLIKGIKCDQQREIKEFDVTVEDITMLLDEYERRTFDIEISNIKVE